MRKIVLTTVTVPLLTEKQPHYLLNLCSPRRTQGRGARHLQMLCILAVVSYFASGLRSEYSSPPRSTLAGSDGKPSQGVPEMTFSRNLHPKMSWSRLINSVVDSEGCLHEVGTRLEDWVLDYW